jgi:hypothetical protein
MKIDDNLSEVFDIAPMPAQQEVITVNEVTPSSSKVEDDYDTSRNNLKDILVKGQAALQHALDVAKQSEHPRAFEVVGNLMKQLADINQQLMDIHQQKKKLDEPSKGEISKQVTNNNAIFVGSTAELNKMISNMNKGA